jgi:hypothetical protein
MVRTTERERGEKKGGGRNSVVFREPASAALLFPFFFMPRARTIPRGVKRRSEISSDLSIARCEFHRFSVLVNFNS